MCSLGVNTSSRYVIYNIPIDSIYADAKFNCRGEFTLASVEELARDIAENGMQTACAVQPMQDVIFKPSGNYEFRLIYGHRRLAAHLVLKRETLACSIHRGLTESAAKLMNFAENIQRNDLTFVQEANALVDRFPPGASVSAIARALSKTSRWVQVRLDYLKMPLGIQQRVQSGGLTQFDIEKLARMPAEAQMEHLDAIDQFKVANSKRSTKVLNPTRKRSKGEVMARNERLLGEFGPGFYAVYANWIVGNVSDVELEDAIDKVRIDGII